MHGVDGAGGANGIQDVHIARETPDQPDVRGLIDALDAYQGALYPPGSNHLLDIGALCRPEVLFVVARDARQRAVACGALVQRAGRSRYGEIKRMFVAPAWRGQGLSRRVLRALEDAADAADCAELRLETGIHQHAALALYRQAGYARCAAFGDYAPDPLSVFMRKPLAAPLAVPPDGPSAV